MAVGWQVRAHTISPELIGHAPDSHTGNPVYCIGIAFQMNYRSLMVMTCE